MGQKAEVRRLKVELKDPRAKAELMTGKPQADLCSWAESEVKGLKGDSGVEAEELDGFGRGGRDRLGGVICNEGTLELGRANGDEGDLKLGLSSGDEDNLELGLTSNDEDDLELGLTNVDEDDLELGLTRDDEDDLELGSSNRDEDDLEPSRTNGDSRPGNIS
ncbi:hypothetical protein DPX16_21504 [Anabarilius grahami]|uniref:Uncharacterized protein n=1 Tax=Anabarilius grahami TaxID=495550 RepID=A0A3N0XUM8_ANAGA|nr:hypothetical protein DPX16_21504 [Anabarilius grahami]